MNNTKIMEAKELRIGNLVQRKGYLHEDNTFSDIRVDKNDIYACVIKPEHFNPILLTEEWLIKFGFKNNYRQYEWANWGMWVEKGLGDDYIVSHGFANAKSELKSIKYVHQLQNLYFALTGEELE